MVLVNELIGNFGKYHLYLSLLIFVNKFGVAFHHMAIIFIAPPAQYYCPDKNETCCDNPVYNRTTFSRTIVTEWDLICEKVWLKDLTQTMFQFGVLVGSLVFGIASDKFGRRPTLIISVIMDVFLGIVCSFLPDYWSFTIVRTVLGISVGGIMVVGFVILMEFVGTPHRDIISAIYHIPFAIGYIVLAIFGYLLRDYMYFLLVISMTNVILLVYICILPETPRWLLAANKTHEAITLMERVAKINKLPTEDIQSKTEFYQVEHPNTRHSKGSLTDLFRFPNLRRNIMVMSFAWFVCSYCFYGMAYYISHLAGDVYVNVGAGGCVCLAASFITIPLIKFLKRRTVVILANVATGFCMLSIAVIPEGNASLAFGIVGVLFSYMIFIVIYLYCSEMFPTVVRNAAIGLSSMMARVGSMIAPFVADLRPYGQWCAPVAFGIFPLMSAMLCVLLPETKGCELMVTLEEGEAFGKRQRGQRDNASSGVT